NLAFAHLNRGLALAFMDQLDEAITEFDEVIRINKDHAEAHFHRGRALHTKGLFQEAIAEYREALRIKKDYAEAQENLGQAEQLAGFEKRRLAVLKVQDQPKDAREWLGLARVCQTKTHKQYVGAARFFSEAFAKQPALAEDMDKWDRYNAACAAVLAAAGQGTDAAGLDAMERARLRRQALDWLRADLKAWGHLLDKTPGKAPRAASILEHWLTDADLAG